MLFIDIPSGQFVDNADNSHKIQPFKLGKYPVTVAEWKEFLSATKYDWKNTVSNINNPVTNVSYNDAEAFCKWAGYRLPTGPEWEWACRAGGPDQPNNIQEIAWCYENSDNRIHPVGQKTPNAWGLYDMLGNCWEWTSEAVGSSSRVLRGGSWGNSAYYLRGSNRYLYDPTYRLDYYGFRCVVSPPEILNSDLLIPRTRLQAMMQNLSLY